MNIENSKLKNEDSSMNVENNVHKNGICSTIRLSVTEETTQSNFFNISQYDVIWIKKMVIIYKTMKNVEDQLKIIQNQNDFRINFANKS